jgi:hypothetical protein
MLKVEWEGQSKEKILEYFYPRLLSCNETQSHKGMRTQAATRTPLRTILVTVLIEMEGQVKPMVSFRPRGRVCSFR